MQKMYMCEYHADGHGETFFVWANNVVGAQRKAIAGLHKLGIKKIESYSVKEVIYEL